MPHTPQHVFLAASEGDDDGVGIAEGAASGGGGIEAWEGVEVAEPSEVGQAAIVPGLADPEETPPPRKQGNSGGQASEVTHTIPRSAQNDYHTWTNDSQGAGRLDATLISSIEALLR